MKYSIYLFVGLFFFVGCFSDKHIAESEMKAIIWEMTSVDEYIKFSHSKQENSTKNYTVERDTLYQKIFDLHKITKQQFYTTYSYYKQNPEKFKVLIDSSLTYGLRQRRTNIEAVKEVAPISPVLIHINKKRDSLIRIKKKELIKNK